MNPQYKETVSLETFDINKITFGPIDMNVEKIDDKEISSRIVKIKYDNADFIYQTEFMYCPFGIKFYDDSIHKKSKYTINMNVIDKYENNSKLIGKNNEFINNYEKYKSYGASDPNLNFMNIMDILRTEFLHFLNNNKDSFYLLVKHTNNIQINDITPIYNHSKKDIYAQQYSPMIKIKLHNKSSRKINKYFYDLDGNNLITEELVDKQFTMACYINFDSIYMTNEKIIFNLYLFRGFVLK
jgi:hypothetical protein